VHQALPEHRFWRDEVAPTEAAVLDSIALVGHCQATDANLLAVAQHHDGNLATLVSGVVIWRERSLSLE
jgi:predicted nucleic acid-binding protein